MTFHVLTWDPGHRGSFLMQVKLSWSMQARFVYLYGGAVAMSSRLGPRCRKRNCEKVQGSQGIILRMRVRRSQDLPACHDP